VRRRHVADTDYDTINDLSEARAEGEEAERQASAWAPLRFPAIKLAPAPPDDPPVA
jgi:hypothetical protein